MLRILNILFVLILFSVPSHADEGEGAKKGWRSWFQPDQEEVMQQPKKNLTISEQLKDERPKSSKVEQGASNN